MRLLSALRRGVTRVEMGRIASGTDPAGKVAQYLFDHGMLTEHTGSPSDDTVEARQFGYLSAVTDDPAAAQEHLAASVVAVLGVGGTGGGIVQHLVGAGVGHLLLADDDRVQRNNLNRQFLFSTGDIGRLKVEAAAERVAMVNPGTAVTTHATRIMATEDVDDVLARAPVDFVAVGLDQPPGIGPAMVVHACWERGIPAIFGGVGITRGFFGPVYAPRFSSHPPLLPAAAVEVETTPFSFGPTNSIITSWISHQILHHLMGAHHVVEYDAQRVVDFSNCAVHRRTSRSEEGFDAGDHRRD